MLTFEFHMIFAFCKISFIFCCCSVAQSCPALCDPMDCNMPGLPVLHYLLEFAQTHVHWAGETIQPSHPLSPPSPPAFNLFQHQGLFHWVSSSHQVAKVLELKLQHQVLLMNIQGWFPLGLTGLILHSKGLSRVFSNTTVQKHHFFGTQPSLWSNSHIHTWLLEKPIAFTRQTFVGKVISLFFNMLSRFVRTRNVKFILRFWDIENRWCLACGP